MKKLLQIEIYKAFYEKIQIMGGQYYAKREKGQITSNLPQKNSLNSEKFTW